MLVLAPISVGELIDKITILQIKQERITDASKLAHVEQELDDLTRILMSLTHNSQDQVNDLAAQLRSVNELLWDIEDFKRGCERDQKFDQEFINAARQVYLKNDLRARIKRDINALTGSTIVEEKSYKNN